MFYTAEAPAGIVEIVQQASNYVYRKSGSHVNIILGTVDAVREIYKKQLTFASVVMSCFFALAMVHLLFYTMMRSYKANLWFMLFCLTWFIRTGYTGPKILSSLLPLSWYAAFRLEYLSIPVGTLLLCLTLHSLFPGVLHKKFNIALAAACSLCAAMCIFTGTVFISRVIMYFYIIIFLAVVYIVVRLCMKVRKPDAEQLAVLIGMGVFLYGLLRDLLYFSDVLFFPFTERTISEVSLLIFVFFQMAAMSHGTTREITAAREAEQKLKIENAALENANRLKADLMATISHETRTPITVISAYTELITMELRSQGLSEQHAKDLDTVSDEIQRIGQLMGEMQKLSLSRNSSSGKEKISPAELIRQTARLYSHILERRKTRLHMDLPDNLPPVFANPGEITQTLLNLFQNSGKHTQGGEVRIEASYIESGDSESGNIVITVSDTGEGIAPELLPRVFERGVSGSEHETGIGLAICRGIVKAHGGDIGIESKIGEGTKVWFSLPVYDT